MASLEGVKAFLVKPGPFGFPVYAYVAGGVALIGGIWYFKTRRKVANGQNTVAPQTNANPVTDALPLPFPTGNSAPVPPSPPFRSPSPVDTSAVYTGSVNPSVPADTTPLPTTTSTFIPPPPVPTTSQNFALANNLPPYAAGPGVVSPNPTYAVQPPTYAAPQYVPPPIANIPIISPIIAKLLRLRE